MVGAIEQVVGTLNAAAVRYLIVGGVAVVLHGHLRTTADLDLAVDLEHDNVLGTVRALAGLGYLPRVSVPAERFADAATRRAWVREERQTVLAFSSDRFPTLGVDVLVAEPFDFRDASTRTVHVSLETTTAPVVSLADLIELKKAAGRPVDLYDVEALQEIVREV